MYLPFRLQTFRYFYENYSDAHLCKIVIIYCYRCQDKSLIFSATGDRDAEVLLTPLKFVNFKKVYFVIPTAFKEISDKNDNYSIMEYRDLIARCQKNEKAWNRLQENGKCSKVTILECVSDALSCIKQNNESKSVLITGSLHLVGAALSIIDPNLGEN